MRVSDTEEMEDVSLALLQLPPMRGRRVAIMSWAGSTGVFTVDACQRYGLELAELSLATLSKLCQLSPPSWLPMGNPIDIWANIGLTGFNYKNFRADFKTILEALLTEENADAVIVIIPDFLELFPIEEWDISSVIAEVTDAFKHRPIVFCIIGPQGQLTTKLERVGRIPIFPSCERAVRALARLRRYTEWTETAQI